jgi:hypothetical protein
MNDAGILLKTKERCGELASEAGMSQKTKALTSVFRNVVENK